MHLSLLVTRRVAADDDEEEERIVTFVMDPIDPVDNPKLAVAYVAAAVSSRRWLPLILDADKQIILRGTDHLVTLPRIHPDFSTPSRDLF